MLAKLYALLTDTYATDAPIYVFRERGSAEEALMTTKTHSAAIIPFFSPDALAGAANGLIFLAMTMEDTGVRIHAAFRSMFRLRTYMLEHVSESTCVTATGWLDPVVRNGALLKEFHIVPALSEQSASAA